MKFMLNPLALPMLLAHQNGGGEGLLISLPDELMMGKEWSYLEKECTFVLFCVNDSAFRVYAVVEKQI